MVKSLEKSKTFGFLSGNILKLIACITMAIDHVGVVFFPGQKIFRIIGRIAFPIFAFMVAEGCKYTKNRLRYFLTIFLLGAVFQVVYYVAEKSLLMNIFITLSLSILIIYALDLVKESIIEEKSWQKIALSGCVLMLVVLGSVLICKKISINYGIWGVMLPVFASIFNFRKRESVKLNELSKKNFIYLNLLIFTVGLVLLAVNTVKIQYYSLIAIPLLLLYSGKRGKRNFKYFYYAFYPAHLVIIYAIAFLF